MTRPCRRWSPSTDSKGEKSDERIHPCQSHEVAQPLMRRWFKRSTPSEPAKLVRMPVATSAVVEKTLTLDGFESLSLSLIGEVNLPNTDQSVSLATRAQWPEPVEIGGKTTETITRDYVGWIDGYETFPVHPVQGMLMDTAARYVKQEMAVNGWATWKLSFLTEDVEHEEKTNHCIVLRIVSVKLPQHDRVDTWHG